MHYRRVDYAAEGVSYLLLDSAGLIDSVLNTNAQDQILVGPAVDGDAIYNGVVDNALGVSCVLEIGRALSENRPRRSAHG